MGTISTIAEQLPQQKLPLDVLVVAPHPDDAELGVGGTISKLIDQGWNVGILDLTNGEPTPHGSPEIRANETEQATRILRLPWRFNLGWRNRFLEPTLECRHQLASVFRLTKPRWLFAPYWEDAHPDHVAATQLIEAARFWSKLTKSDLEGEPHHPSRILYYYCVHLKLAIRPAFIVDISDHWDRKEQAIACYASQFTIGRDRQQPSFIDRLRDEAGNWGRLIGTQYGEPFASREPIGLRELDALI